MSLKVTPLSFEQIRSYAKETGRIFVINHTDLSRKQPRGDYFIAIPDPQGRDQPVKIPNTWVPIDMASFVRVEDVLNSTNFISAIRKGVILAVSPEEAALILKRPDAKNEVARVIKENEGLGNIGESGAEVSIDTTGASAQATPLSNSAQEEAQQSDNPSDRLLKQLVKLFNDNQIPEDTAVTQLTSMNPPPSLEALQDAAESVGMKSSPFYHKIAEGIADAMD